MAFPDHLGPAGGTATAWERLCDWLTGAGHGAALFPCPSRTKALGVTVDDPGHFLDARTRPEPPAPGAPVPRAPGADFAAAARTVPAASGLALRHTGPPELIPFTYLRLAVTAGTHGLLPTGRPPLPYYLEFTPASSPHPERQVAVDVYVLPGNPPAPA
ncbi:hypothetical protein ACIBJD_19020 [Kitasatospora sp. NPDC050467]|uniref:hypothetical protein n=1 Tax=Kitasatospora sp. NPDC050467 TaxID=3364053 RepID=UPI0037BDE79D